MRVREMAWVGVASASVLCLCAAEAVAQGQDARIARLIEQLAGPDSGKQDDARRQLEQIGEPAQAALLVAMGKHADVTVRAKAQGVLTRIWAAKVDRLIETLGEDHFEKRDAADRELQRLVLAHLRQRGARGKHADPAVEVRGLIAMKSLTRAGADAADLEVRRGAGRALRRAYAARVADLIPLLGDDEFDKREGASRELVAIGTPALEPLRKAEFDKDLETRRRVREAIDAIKKAAK